MFIACSQRLGHIWFCHTVDPESIDGPQVREGKREAEPGPKYSPREQYRGSQYKIKRTFPQHRVNKRGKCDRIVLAARFGWNAHSGVCKVGRHVPVPSAVDAGASPEIFHRSLINSSWCGTDASSDKPTTFL